MGKVLVLFASKSDEESYNKVVIGLKDKGIDYDLRLASAHKTPDLVEEIIKSDDYNLIISGAGLAAHLPGVVAAKKIIPVLGVPCPGAYDMLDSFLSIVQMPPGIPVLAVMAENAAEEANKILDNRNKVSVVGEGKAASKAMKTLEELGVSFEMGEIMPDAVNLVFTDLGSEVARKDELVIYCPTFEEETRAQNAESAMDAAENGLWVGVNRGENAAIAAAEILGKDEELKKYRKELGAKVIEADGEVKNDK
jgi:5-(carboxyamino)imidazole ribonucleotide mutase